MDVTKCRTNLRLRSALFLIEAATGKIIKVWYEPEWDPITTRVFHSFVISCNVSVTNRTYFRIFWWRKSAFIGKILGITYSLSWAYGR